MTDANTGESDQSDRSDRKILGTIDYEGHHIGRNRDLGDIGILEELLFRIDIEQSTDGRLHPGDIRPDRTCEDVAAFCRWWNFVPRITGHVQDNIDDLEIRAADENMTVLELLASIAAFPPASDPDRHNPLQLIMGV